MDFLKTWVEGIIVAVIIATIIEMLLPNGNNKKYVKVVIGIYIVFTIISPIINKISGNTFEVSSIFNIDKLSKEIEMYEINNSKIEDINQKNISDLYIKNLEGDIREKLKSKGYLTQDIEIKIENNNTYQIKEIKIKLDTYKLISKEDIEEVSSISNIEKVDIEINVNKDKKEEEKSNEVVTHKEKTEIIKYIAEIYGINEKSIIIY